MNMMEENGNCTIEYGFPNIEGDTEFEMKVINNNPDKEYRNCNKNNIEKKIVLDDSHDKRKYLNSTRKIIICGTDEFVIDTSNLLKYKDTYTVMF